MKISVEISEPVRDQNQLVASASVRLEFGESIVAINDIRFVATQSGELLAGLPTFQTRGGWLPIIELSDDLRAAILRELNREWQRQIAAQPGSSSQHPSVDRKSGPGSGARQNLN